MRTAGAFFLFACCGLLVADIAPLSFDGVALHMEKNDAVHMRSETVDIFYRGSEWLVQARFEMENVTAKNVALEIGFPVEREIWDASQRGPECFYDFKVRSGGGKVPVVTPRAVCDYSGLRRMNYVWSCWKQEFKPGRTVVEVEYRTPIHFFLKLSPRATWGEWVSQIPQRIRFLPIFAREMALLHFSYVLASGSMWRGRIGAARLTVHFPLKIAREQVTIHTNPGGYVIGSDSITWRFKDFEPQPHDDVRLEFISHPFFGEVTRLRERVKTAPREAGPRLELANLFFLTLLNRGPGCYLPRSLTAVEMNGILERIPGVGERSALLRRYFRKGPLLEIDDSNWQQDRDEHALLAGILSRAGYEPDERPDLFRLYMNEVEKLLEDALAMDPGNTLVWNSYLFYYHRFHFCGIGIVNDFGCGPVKIQDNQKKLVRWASRACPQDPGIRAWLGLIGDLENFVPEYAGDLCIWSKRPHWETPGTIGHGGHTLSDKAEDIDLIREFYGHRMDPLPVGPISSNDLLRAVAKVLNSFIWGNAPNEFRLVLKKRDLSPADKTRLTALLRRVGFYEDHYAKQIWNHAVKTGIAQDCFDRKVTR